MQYLLFGMSSSCTSRVVFFHTIASVRFRRRSTSAFCILIHDKVHANQILNEKDKPASASLLPLLRGVRLELPSHTVASSIRTGIPSFCDALRFDNLQTTKACLSLKMLYYLRWSERHPRAILCNVLVSPFTRAWVRLPTAFNLFVVHWSSIILQRSLSPDG